MSWLLEQTNCDIVVFVKRNVTAFKNLKDVPVTGEVVAGKPNNLLKPEGE